MRKITLTLLALAGLLSVSSTASAGVVSADYKVVMDLEFCCTSPGGAPSISEVIGATTVAGAELTVADRAINPSNWGGHIAIDMNGAGTGFTLFNDDGGNVFQSAIVTISNIVSDMGNIVGVNMISNDLFVSDTSPFSTLLGFTADSITFSVLIDDQVPGANDVWEITDVGMAMFDIEFARATVPEPAPLALLGLGLMGLGLARKRRS